MAEGELSHEVIILIVVVGAAAVIVAGYGLHRALSSRQSSDEFNRKFNERNAEQDQYMVDLRMAYRNGIMADARSYRQAPRPRHSQESSAYGKSSELASRQEQHSY